MHYPKTDVVPRLSIQILKPIRNAAAPTTIATAAITAAYVVKSVAAMRISYKEEI